ncbi:hypothetical protein AB4Y67_12740 [Arthrobacter sp. YAF17]|uniref:hypothetical protein n=1 Tax=Arthrobacter sp. YAF17 TaxID=3233077 RepID=UPI003F8F34C7
MTAEVSQQVQSMGELSVGDQIEAWHNGKLFHRGEVIRTVADTDLFWILDEGTGTRRLIDTEALVIVRVPVPAAGRGPAAAFGAAAGSEPSMLPPAKAPGAVRPASHVPLFQAPALVP